METTTSTYETTPQEQPNIWKLGGKSGLITGLILFIFALIFQFILEVYFAWWLMAIPFLGYTIAIVMTHKTYKSEGNGLMSYGKGVGLGVILGGVAGLVAGILSFLYINVVDPSIPVKQADAAIEAQMEMMESFGASDADIDKMMDAADEQREATIEGASDPLKSIGSQLAMGLAFGLILALVIAAFTRKNDPSVEY